MGISTLYGRTHVLSAELDCEWATCDVDIHYELLPPEESMPFGAFELLKVVTRIAGVSEEVNVTGLLNQSYIEDLIRDEIGGADVCVGEYYG